MDADTIHVFFRPSDPRFAGAALDTAVRSNFAERYPEYGEIFATYRFHHSPGRVGYLLRVPSQYSSTALDLWIYDSTSARFLEPLRVADKFGDGLWRFTEDGWLVDIDGDGVRDLVQRRRDRWLDDETDEAHESDSLFVSLWSGSRYPQPSVSLDARLGVQFDIPDWNK